MEEMKEKKAIKGLISSGDGGEDKVDNIQETR